MDMPTCLFGETGERVVSAHRVLSQQMLQKASTQRMSARDAQLTMTNLQTGEPRGIQGGIRIVIWRGAWSKAGGSRRSPRRARCRLNSRQASQGARAGRHDDLSPSLATAVAAHKTAGEWIG